MNVYLRSFVFLLILIFAFSLTGFSAEKKLNRKNEKAFSKALKLEKEKQFPKALAEYEKILKSYPASTKVLERCAYLYMRSGDLKIASEMADKAIATGNSCPISFNIKGMIFENNNEYGKAEIYYSRAIKSDQSYASPYNNLGNLFLKYANLDKAETHYKKAISLDGNNPLFYNNLGYIKELKGDIGEAERNYIKAQELNPSFQTASENLERMRQIQSPKRPSEAEIKLSSEICKIKVTPPLRFLGAFKSKDGSATSVYDYEKKQKFILKQLPKENPFNETIFEQTVLEHKNELLSLLKDSAQADKMEITGQGYVMGKNRPILYVRTLFSKNNILFEGIFCIISSKKTNKHLLITSIANKGFYNTKFYDSFIKSVDIGLD